ncbi:MAG: hypothetical protein K2X81_26630 [Candidatus Obscuribacterales bacterium]|nr:hypothetical protein [Candidatus Obscuribacterales bacterium]
MNNLEHLEPTESKAAAPRLELSSSELSPSLSELNLAKQCGQLPNFNGPRFEFPTTIECKDLFANADRFSDSSIRAAFKGREQNVDQNASKEITKNITEKDQLCTAWHLPKDEIGIGSWNEGKEAAKSIGGALDGKEHLIYSI